MADLRKLKDEATQAFTKGKFAKSAELFESLCNADPKDFQARMKWGDALAKAGKKDKAVSTYKHLAELYANEGFLPKAIAVCKVILQLDPKHSSTQQILAGLYANKLGPDAPQAKSASGIRPVPTSATSARPASSGLRPAAPAVVPPAPAAAPVEAAPTASAEPSIELELDRSDRAQGGFSTPAAPATHELPAELDPVFAAPTPAAAPPPPEPVAPPPAPEPVANLEAAPPPPPPAAQAVPGEIEVPLELDVELSPAAAGKSAPGVTPEEDEPLVAPAPARPQTKAPSLSDWGSAADSISAQLETAADDAPIEASDPALAAAEADAVATDDDEISVDVAFDVPVADSAEEEIEVLSVTAEIPNTPEKPLPKIPLFSDLSPDAFVTLTEQCGFIRAEPGQTIIKQGDAANSFFVVCSGKMKVVKQSPEGEEIVMAYLAEGAFFGEMALLSGTKRTATVVAEEESDLLEISAPVLNGLVKQHPHVASSIRQFGRQRLLADVMATSALFRPFDRSDRKRLVELFKVREVQPAEVVIAEGQSADGLYLVMSGELEVKKGKAVLATLHEGDIFGEMSLLSKKPATASVSAKKRTNVLRLPRERFEELIVTYPQVLVLVSELADSRTRANAQSTATVLAPDSGAPRL